MSQNRKRPKRSARYSDNSQSQYGGVLGRASADFVVLPPENSSAGASHASAPPTAKSRPPVTTLTTEKPTNPWKIIGGEAKAEKEEKKRKRKKRADVKSKEEEIKNRNLIGGGEGENDNGVNDADMEENSDSNYAGPISRERSAQPAKKDITPRKKKLNIELSLLRSLYISSQPFTISSLAEYAKQPDSTVQFTLLSLVDKKMVVKKDFERTRKDGSKVIKTLYWCDVTHKSVKEAIEKKGLLSSQSTNEGDDASDAQMLRRNVTENDVRTCEAELKSWHKRGETIKKDISQLSAEPLNIKLDEALRKAEEELEEVRQKVDKLKEEERQRRDAGEELPTPASVKKKINTMRLEWKNRKMLCTDFLERLAEGMEKKNKEIIKILDIVDDEMEGVKMPEKYDV